MRHITLLMLVISCGHAGTPPVAGRHTIKPPAGWHDDGGMTEAQADEYCAAEVTCKSSFAIYQAPPSPCAHKGTRCIEPIPPGHWICSCNECSADADCGANMHCGINEEQCTTERQPMRCLPGPSELGKPPPPCPVEPPIP
jgi:hypothetical protein